MSDPMPSMMPGARKLPAQHLSVRVPWHDTAWDGRVCRDPLANTSCLALRNVAENKDDAQERACAGSAWKDLGDRPPPCVEERAGILSADALVRFKQHPYKQRNKNAYAHFEQTELRFAPHAAACIPFRWMLRSTVEGSEYDGPGLMESLSLGYQPERERAIDDRLGFKPAWVQDFTNQRILLDTFFGALEPQHSLCFIYAKRTPLSERPGRVLVGVGLVTGVSEPVEYRYNVPAHNAPFRSLLWERNVFHSIRADGMEGFVLPYQEILARAAQDPRIDPEMFTVFAPDAAREQFSYASEHVSHDHAIGSLLAFVPVLERLGELVAGPWNERLAWIDAQLNRLWKMRGPFPGMGSALNALGLARGNLIAWQIAALQERLGSTWTESPWAVVDTAMKDPSILGSELSKDLGASWRKNWSKLPAQRRALLELLSRFDLSAAQALRFYEPVERANAGIDLTDKQLLENPYLLYERDRGQMDATPLEIVDRGVLPDPVVREQHPVPAPSALDDDADARRLRAFVVSALEEASGNGHTLQTREQVIRAIGERGTKPKVPCTTDTLAASVSEFSPVVNEVPLEGGRQALQLDRYGTTGAIIRSEIDKRARGKRHVSSEDWRKRIDLELEKAGAGRPSDEAEERARHEKAAALGELFAARVSVLIGPAGTGKTTLLRALCNVPAVTNGGVLLLAPTGKARVRLATSARGFEARTVAQCLLASGRYDPSTGTYRVLPDAPKTEAFKTVVLDECSMLTEEALAAVLDELRGVERLILVGDPRQLPPIGSGRPFVDIVRRLTPENPEALFPRVGRGYAELTVPRRQRGESAVSGASGAKTAPERDDVLMASWFGGGAVNPGADEVWDRPDRHDAGRLLAVRWDTPQELEARLFEVLQSHLGLTSADDEIGFERSYGGSEFNGAAYFHARSSKNPEGAAAKVERWQILTPVRAGVPGVEHLNRAIQSRFRTRVRAMAEKSEFAKVPKPVGPQQILYGDKVISVVNGERRYVWPKPEGRPYVANGDIGVVVGEYDSKPDRYRKRSRIDVEFASQQGLRYNYFDNEFSDDGNPPLELAYALTIHKAQGSEFGVTFVIVPQPCRLLSRELLYTALTRQSEKVVLLHQGDLRGLRDFGSESRSEIARRLTNLFRAPSLLEGKEGTFLDAGLVHRTRRGELVRSKSELIIANILQELGIDDYQYERALKAPDGSVRYPDFTVEDAASGTLVYIEHLGMMDDPSYRARWAKKLAWYRAQGIRPFEEGPGEAGTLVVTTEGGGAGFDEPAIRRKIATALGLPAR